MTMTEIPGMSTPEDYDGNPPGDFQHLTNHPTPGQSTTASGSSSDPTLSLRAAALLTLKSKRRKPATGQSPALPPRPIPSDASVQLDYGQADLTTSDAAPSMVESTSMPSVSSQALISSEAEDGQVREEGEISDTEESAPTAPPIVHPSSTDNISGADRKPMFPRTTSSNSTPVARTEPTSQPLLQRISDPIQLSPIAGPSRLTPPHIPKVESPLPENPNMIDTDHVRPGLAMNQAQYDAAKDIVLDLLGWGVDPEYFLDCGLTRQIVYYTFSELNLRLPNNLDTIGLLPYTPEIISSTQSSPSRRRRSSSLSVPSSQSNICADSLHESPPTRSLGHPSLPPRPRGPRVSSSVSPSLPQVTPAATSLAASSTSAEPGPSLHDMEQQRRQELLARKAVQASRKQKTILIVDGSREAGPPSSVTPSSSNEIRDYDVEMTPIVPREVDDFLKSIGPSNDAGKGKEEAVSRPSTAADRLKQLFFPKPDDMDVDGPIPGFVTSAHTGSPAASEPPLALYSSSAPQVYYPEPTTPASADPLPSPASEPPPSSAESIMTQAGRSVVTEISFDTEETYLNGGPPDPPRRGTKRPVAADFVDFEPRSSVGSGYTNGHGNMLARRKTGSFASVSGMRRCVIDLSDSEDDGEDGERRRAHSVDGEDYQMGRRTHSPVPMRHGSSAPTPTPQHSGRNTPPQLSSTGTMSPAALQEKEQEIRRMRELIAKREESRLKKLAAVSGRTTPNIATANPAFALVGDPPVTTASGEDEESTPTLITPPIANGSANHYPSNGHSSKDTMEEDSPTQDDTHERSRLQQSALITSIPDVPASASTSTGAATSPIDYFPSNAVEDTSPGGQVITAEARQESVVIPSTFSILPDEDQPGDPVDADPQTSSSTQMRQDQARRPDDGFAAYDSPFESYPLLRTRLRPVLSDRQQQQADHFLSSSPNFLSFASSVSTYLKPLRIATILKSFNPSKRICQYEVPGGGVCRDVGCEDVHLGRGSGKAVVNVEPGDADTAEYLHNLFPQYGGQAIRTALEGARQGKTTAVFEDRVAETLAVLGSATQ